MIYLFVTFLKMSSEDWTSVRDEKKWRRSVRQNLKDYAGGRFKTIDKAAWNLLCNIKMGICSVYSLSFRETMFLEFTYGAEWHKMF